jgi:hypothetical protein
MVVNVIYVKIWVSVGKRRGLEDVFGKTFVCGVRKSVYTSRVLRMASRSWDFIAKIGMTICVLFRLVAKFSDDRRFVSSKIGEESGANRGSEHALCCIFQRENSKC